VRAIGAALSLGALVLLGGCERRKLTEADCARIKGRLEGAWERDALAAQREATNDVFVKFVRDEKGRIGADWMRKCTPMIGRDVSEEELTCLDRADTIDDVYECGL
jgi:hypothetical protein